MKTRGNLTDKLFSAILELMEAAQALLDTREEKLQSAADKSHTSEWVVILLLLTIMPVGLYFMFREKRYHSWFPTCCGFLLAFVCRFILFLVSLFYLN